jgi:short-subunit dehydrogenase
MKKTILIAGANSELAVSIVDKLEKKFQLVLLYRDKIKRLPKKNKKIIYIKVDYFRNFQDALIKKLKQKKLSISSIIHFNGTHKFSTINSLSINDFKEVYDINCLTFIQLVKLAKAQYCFKELESILTISSVSSFKGNKAISLYSSSKAALNNLVKSFALELSKKKIRVNSIVLGHIEKGMGKKPNFF